MKRLLGLLLAMLLALPAVQAGAHQLAPTQPVMAMHDMSMHDMTIHHHHDGAPSPAHAAHHDCLGCIAPIDVRLYRPAATPRSIIAREVRPTDMGFLLAGTLAPEPPPPRITV